MKLTNQPEASDVDVDEARHFLDLLEPGRGEFTFQTFDDRKGAKKNASMRPAWSSPTGFPPSSKADRIFVTEAGLVIESGNSKNQSYEELTKRLFCFQNGIN